MSRRGWWRRLTAVVVALIGLVVLGTVLPTTAGALPGLPDCKVAPTPEVPGRGVEAFFEPAPATPPPAADPFAPGATTTIHDQYGYAGLTWNTYGLGCLSGISSPEVSVGTTVANWLFTLPKAVTAATGAMLGAAYQPDFLGVFDPLIATVVDALQRSVFQQWIGLMVAGLGFLIIWRARKSSLSGTAAAIGWALFVMTLATVLFRWPLAAGHAADATVTTTMSSVTSALNEKDATGRSSTGQLAASNLHDALLYQVWLGGEFGDANSVAARRYGAQLFDAQALTWAQAATLAQDPAAGQQIIQAKEAKFTQIAAEVQAEDPDAYAYLTGQRTDARVGFAALSTFAVACAVPFLLIASLLVIGALVITRFAVMLFPAIATLGMFPAMRSVVIGVGNTVAAAVINALVFGIGTAVMVKAFGVLMAPGTGLPSWLVVALLLLLTLVMWFMLRPVARLTSMVSPGGRGVAAAGGALGSVTRGLTRVGGRLAGSAAGMLGGRGEAADADDGGDRDRPGTELERAGVRRRLEADGEAVADDPQDADDRNTRAGPGKDPVGAGPVMLRGLGGRPGRGRTTAGRDADADRPHPPGRRDEEQPLIAAELGLPGGSRRPAVAVERAVMGGRTAASTSDQAHQPVARAPTRASGPGVRRSEGADLEDQVVPFSRLLDAPGSATSSAGSEDFDGEEVFVVYRPDDPARGGRRG